LKSVLKSTSFFAALLMFFVLAAASNGTGVEPLQGVQPLQAAQPRQADEKYRSTIDEVELTGKLTAETFNGPRGRAQREFMLNLLTPVNVDKDETQGPTKNVSKIQLGLFNGRIKARVRRLINKKCRVKGILFYGNRPSHHTVILMDVKDAARARR